MSNANSPTRFPAGVVNSTQDGPFGDFLVPRHDTYFTFCDDFLRYTATDWVVTETQVGATQTLSATGLGGWLVVTNSAADADNVSMQWAGGSGVVSTQFAWEPTKDMVVAARFKSLVVVDQAVMIGLAITDTSPLATLPADGIFFYKPDLAPGLAAVVRKTGVSSTVALGSMVADTFVDCVLFYTAADGKWRAFLNGTLIGSLSTASISPTVSLAPTIALLNGDAVANVLSVDRLLIAKQR